MPRVKDHAKITPTGVLNTDTASSASSFPLGNCPSSTERGLVPAITHMTVRSLIPELPEHIRTKLARTTGPTGPNAAEDRLADAAAAGNNNGSAALPPADASVVSVAFDMHPVSAPLANLLRRLMVTEVPTMAFDRVLIEENDTPVYDEMLCQRLAMVPIQCDPSGFDFVTSESVPITAASAAAAAAAASESVNKKDAGASSKAAAAAAAAAPAVAKKDGASGTQTIYSSSKHVLRFDLDVAVPLDAPMSTVVNVYASHLKWVPLPGQEALDVRVVHPELLLAKIGCGQRLKLQAFALKGIGLTHAKWSPVSACYYEMRTHVEILKPITGEKARQLVALAPAVFALEQIGAGGGGAENSGGADNVRAIVKKAVAFHDCSRLYMDGVDFQDYLSVEKQKDAVRFTYESLGQYRDHFDVPRIALLKFEERLRYLKQQVERTRITNADKFQQAADEAE